MVGGGGILQIVIWVVDCRLKRQNLDCRLRMIMQISSEILVEGANLGQVDVGRMA